MELWDAAAGRVRLLANSVEVRLCILKLGASLFISDHCNF